MNWLLIAVICIIAWNVVRGYTRGVLRMVYSLAAWIVMLAASTMAAPYVRDQILSQTGIEPVILNGIEKSKEVPFERVLFAIGIRFVGETTAKKLALQFKNIHELCNATYDELMNIDDVGTKVAQSIVNYFLQPENLETILRLEKAGLCFTANEQQSALIENILDGSPVVVSGIFSIPREELKVIIEKYGGKNVSSISKNTQYLIVGENMGPEKRKKAEKLNVPMISEDEFYKLLKLK